MRSQEWLPAVAEICRLNPPVWVFGGIAEEVLLEGSVTGDHGDVDVLVGRTALGAHLESFRAVGYSAFQVYFEVVPGEPLVLGAERDGMSIEVGVYDDIDAGLASFVLPTADGLIRFSLPDDTFRHPVTEIDGRPVRTVSPLALFHLREAFLRSGAFGPPRDKDAAIQTRLREQLLAGVPPESLRLRTVPA